MTEAATPLFPMFRSRLQTRMVDDVLLEDLHTTQTQLAERLGADRKNVSVEVNRLVEAGVFTSRPVGRSREIAANKEAPFYEPLLQLLTVVEGPPLLVRTALHEVPEVRAAYIYGSWAAHARGVAGPQPRDVDVMVLTDERTRGSTRRTVLNALDDVIHNAGRAVNATFATVTQWRTSQDRFLTDVRDGPLIAAIPLDEE